MKFAESFRQFFALDFESLPSEVLLAIQHKAAATLQKRGELRRLDSFRSQKTAGRRGFYRNLKALNALLDEDWSALFSGDPERRYYVYAHVNPFAKGHSRFVKEGRVRIDFKGLPFYIGKGTGDRAFDMKRNQGHGQQIRQVLDAGATVAEVAHILADKLTEAEALELESKLIHFYGTVYQGGKEGLLLNLDVPPRP